MLNFHASKAHVNTLAESLLNNVENTLQKRPKTDPFRIEAI